jgi:hypothetical protein
LRPTELIEKFSKSGHLISTEDAAKQPGVQVRRDSGKVT